METHVDEIADHIYRLSTFVPDIGPTGFTFNQFLIDADEPAIFHTGPRGMFPMVSEAVASVLPVETLRWVMFGHLEADECGAMNLFLAAAPNAQVAHTAVGCMVSINDLADRTPAPIDPDGSYEHFAFPDLIVTNICFGGADMRDAWVTCSSTGKLFKCRWPRPGLKLNFNA